MNVLRLPAVLQRVGLSRSTLYHFIQHDAFPPPLKLGSRASGWLEDDINKWLRDRMLARVGRIPGG